MASFSLAWKAVSPLGSSPPARSSHAMAASEDNTVYCFGGMSSAGAEPAPVNDLYKLSVDGKPTWNVIAAKGDVPSPREGATLTYLPNTKHFLLFGGGDDNTEFNDLYTLDPATNTWKIVKSIGTPPSKRLNHAATYGDGFVYIVGGFHDGLPMGDIFKLDTKNFKWTSPCKTTSQRKRCNHTVTAVGTKLIVFGGRAGEVDLFNDIEVYDTVSNTWSSPGLRGSPPSIRDFHTAARIGADGRTICIFGGANEVESKGICEYYNDVHLFNVDTYTWTSPTVSGTSPAVRWSHGAVATNNGEKMYVFGGAASDDDFNDLHVLEIGQKGKPARPGRPTSVSPAKGGGVATPDVNYDTPNPAPATRRRVVTAKLERVGLRNYDKQEQEATSAIKDIFANIKAEYEQIDNARAALNADRDAFAAEKAQNEELFETQQKELAALREKVRRESEAWLAQNKAEIDAEREKLAAEQAQMNSDQAKLAKDREALMLDRAEQDARESAFEEKQKKMDAIMAQFKGIT